MFETVAMQKRLKSTGIRSTFLAVAFLIAQLVISYHHVGDAHGVHDSHGFHDSHELLGTHASHDSQDDFSVECEVCTVSAGIFDTPFVVAVIPHFQRSQTPDIAGIESSLPPAGDRLHPPRAPPLNS